jgi:plasmid maintenance system antidote protein VapI
MPKVILKPTAPGEMLLEEFMIPLELSQYKLAKALGVSKFGSAKLSEVKGRSPQTPLCA